MNVATSIKQRFHYLDSLRGLAALIVFFSHLINTYALPERLQFLGNTPLRIFWHGEGAVIFFFLISGFVLSHQLSNVKNILKSDNYIKYVLNRINRIYPAFFIMIVISLVMRKYMSYESYEMVIPSQWFSEIILTPMSFSLFIKEALVVFPIPSSSRILPHGWTLVIEILISIILPFLIYLMRGSKAALFIFTIFCTKLLGFHLSIIVFVCGIYLYEYKYEITEKTKKYSIISRLLLFLIGWLLFTLEFYSPSSVVKLLSKIFINYLIPGCLILFIIIVSSETIKRILQKPVLLHLGKISYSMYLIHFNVIIFFSGYISSFCNTYLTKNVYIDYFSFVLIMTTIMLFFSNVFYYVIERSVLIFGKHLLLKFYKE